MGKLIELPNKPQAPKKKKLKRPPRTIGRLHNMPTQIEPISQFDLVEVAVLRKERRQIDILLRRKRERIRKMLALGAKVEDGLREAELKVRLRILLFPSRRRCGGHAIVRTHTELIIR